MDDVTTLRKTAVLNLTQISLRCTCMATWSTEKVENAHRARTAIPAQIPAPVIHSVVRYRWWLGGLQ